MERLDKILARELNITRTQAKALIRQKRITINAQTAKSADTKCGENDSIAVDGKAIECSRHIYIMMNKPKGVISASDGKGEQTVVDILPDELKRKKLFPAGRLDKDTTGFILITDDGEFAHDILSPKKHIDKTYIATLDKPFDEAVKKDFESGMMLDKKLLAAQITAVDGDYRRAQVVLRQGLYHQIKRMFKKHGITVTELERTAMGALRLDSSLAYGQCRLLNADELKRIKTK